MLPLRKTYEIIAYAYEAGLHCPDCSVKRFPRLLESAHTWIEDHEGNAITPYTLGDAQEDDYCDDCRKPLDC